MTDVNGNPISGAKIGFANDGVHYVTTDANGQTRYVTRGDSNGESDDYKPCFSDIQGRYTGDKIPILGMFVLFMQSSIGIITVTALVYCLIMIDVFTSKILKAQQKRLELLSTAIDFKNETELGEMKASFTEVIYYKGYSYRFDEDEFINKEEITNKEVLEKSASSVIKVRENKKTHEITSKEILVENNEIRKEGE